LSRPPPTAVGRGGWCCRSCWNRGRGGMPHCPCCRFSLCGRVTVRGALLITQGGECALDEGVERALAVVAYLHRFEGTVLVAVAQRHVVGLIQVAKVMVEVPLAEGLSCALLLLTHLGRRGQGGGSPLRSLQAEQRGNDDEKGGEAKQCSDEQRHQGRSF